MVEFHHRPQPHLQRWHHNIAVQLERVTLATLVASLVYFPGLLSRAYAQPSNNRSPQFAQSQATSQANMVLGVVRSSDNADQWQTIVDRLNAAGVSYQVIEWEQVEQDTRFDGITVIFLADVETITPEQVLALQNWVNRGGGVIVSGPTGQNASSGVRRALQSLLGAYWESSLAQSVTLQPIALNSQRWLREGDTNTPIIGGALIPTGMGAQSIATWDSERPNRSGSRTGNTIAIVTTRQTVFMGWRWGSPDESSAAFDSSWLRATLNHFQDLYPVASASAPSSVATPQPALPGDRPSATSTESSTDSSTRPMPPFRPDRESAPPGLVVEPGALPISMVEAVAMQQELENLIGRYESALLAADSAAGELDAVNEEDLSSENDEQVEDEGEENFTLDDAEGTRLTASVNTASVDDTRSIASNRERNGLDNEILEEARQKLDNFSDLVKQREYAAARQEWLEARQLLWDNFPTDRPLAQAEVRAIWLDRETIVNARSPEGLAQIFDRLATAGINTVFLETVNAGYPIYPSEVAPQQNPLTRHWDPLAAAIELAHERDMELHAWVWTFAAGNEAHNRIVNLPLHYPGPVLSAHPDWASYDNQGNMILPGQEEPFYDPANPAVRRYLMQLFEEIVTRYDVDGLHLDYIRYPFQNPNADRSQGYGIAARQQFQRLTGVDPIELSVRDPLWPQWTEFRVNQINTFVAETSRLVHRLNPDLILSTAVFALPEQERIQKIQQNWEVWAQQGDVDMIVVMTYAADTHRLEQLAAPWLIQTEMDLGSTIILPGIRILNLSDRMVFDQIQALRDLPSGGYALFATAHLHENLHEILHRTQGNQLVPVPYREPFAAASNRFDALQREWNLLLSQDQLWLRSQDLERWRSQIEELQQVLAELADEPSSAELQQARVLLQAFQADFDDWMRLQSMTQGYRVRTWENRLATIKNLLDFGDRVVLQQPGSPQASSP